MKGTPSMTIGQVFEGTHHFNNAGLCPHCGVLATFSNQGPGSIAGAQILPAKNWAGDMSICVGQCASCRGVVLGAHERSTRANISNARYLWPLEEWPDGAPDDLEKSVKSSYDEARSILALSPMGAAVLARRCLQQIIRTRLGIRKRRLFDEIQEAVGRPEFSQSTREALGHIREIGNWSAHPEVDQSDTVIEVTRPEAEYTLQALELVFEDLYVTPQRTKVMKEKIAGKKVGATPGATDS